MPTKRGPGRPPKPKDDIEALIRKLGIPAGDMDDTLRVSGTIVLQLRRAGDGMTRTMVYPNIVTDAGDTYYAQRGAAETPTNFGTPRCLLGNDSTPTTPAKGLDWSDLSVISGSEKAPSSTYPKTNDTDTDNTGKGVDVVTWKFEWTTSDFNDTVYQVAIAQSGASGTDPLLMYATPTNFTKDSSTTLTLWINHTMLGV